LSQSERKIVVSLTCPNCRHNFEIYIIAPLAMPAVKPFSASDLLGLFPSELKPLLRVEDAGDKFIVKPTKWLGKEKFNAAMAVVRQKGGEYIPAGKDSYFSIPKKA
jgi:hypothetical protein